MEFKECVQTRRSIREYEKEDINRDDLVNIVELSKMSPTWKNSQTIRYIVVENKEVIEQIANEGLLGSDHNKEICLGCNALVIIAQVNGRCGYERDGSFTTNKGTGWEMFDAGIATQTFCLAAHDKGYGTCIMGIFDDKKIADIINLPDGQSVAALVSFGKPLKEVSAPPRKNVDDILRFI